MGNTEFCSNQLLIILILKTHAIFIVLWLLSLLPMVKAWALSLSVKERTFEGHTVHWRGSCLLETDLGVKDQLKFFKKKVIIKCFWFKEACWAHWFDYFIWLPRCIEREYMIIFLIFNKILFLNFENFKSHSSPPNCGSI